MLKPLERREPGVPTATPISHFFVLEKLKSLCIICTNGCVYLHEPTEEKAVTL